MTRRQTAKRLLMLAGGGIVAFIAALLVLMSAHMPTASAADEEWYTISEDGQHISGVCYMYSTGYSSASDQAYFKARMADGSETTALCLDHDKWAPGRDYYSFSGTWDESRQKFYIIIDGTHSSTRTRYENDQVVDHNHRTSDSSASSGQRVGMWWAPAAGKGRLTKRSSDKARDGTTIPTAGNPNYALSGIVYTIYDSTNTAKGTLTLDGTGTATSGDLLIGSYTVKETSNNSTGYYTDTASHDVTVASGVTTDWGPVYDDPMYGHIVVTKNSASTSQPVELAGFTYTVVGAASYNQAVTRTITTDATGVAVAKNLPLGPYTVTETTTPVPYYQDRPAFSVTLSQADNAGNLTGCVADSTVSGTALRNVYKVGAGDERTKNRQWGYLELVKRNEATGGIVTKDSFKWYLYQQNRNWSNARDDAHLIAIAQTNQGAAISGTAEKGKAVFMERNGTNPKSGAVAKLPVVNTTNADEGYYEIVEVATTDPFWKNAAVYRVTIKADGNQGKTVADISLAPNTGTARTAASVFDDSGRPVASIAGKNGIAVADSPDTTQRAIANTTEVQFPDAPWAYLKAIKKNTATAGTVTKKQFRFALYQQNAARNLPRTQANLIGVAVTSSGKATSGTEVLGEAVFMVPNADGTPSQTPAELPVVNRLNPNEGYYDVWETDVVEPFWPTEDRYQVTISAADDNGATKADITAKAGETATTIFKNGQPISQITGEAGIKVADSPTATLRENANTTPLEIANDQYAFIEVVKKNMELANLGRDGATVAEAGFRFKLYDTLANAEAETNALEEVTTDASGKAAFKTRLSVRGTARSDPSSGSKRIHIASQTSSPTDRNDGVYYVRESYAKMPYNKSNAIYRFTISADGNEGNVSYVVDVKDPTDHNNPYTKSFASYPNGNGIAVHDSSVSGFSGAGVNNVCPTTVADAPQYGRIKITKTDSEDGSLQQGAEYQVYAEKEVTYTSQGLVWTPENAGTSQRTPTAGNDNVTSVSGEAVPTGYTKTSSYNVNTHPAVAGADASKIRQVANTDVARTTKIPAGSSTFDAATGKVTVTNPVVFTRADGTTYDTIVTDANGTATTGWLPIDYTGTTRYFIVETKTSNGHVIDGNRFYADLKYDASLQDRECVIASKWTTNNPKVSQADKPNEVDIVKTVLPSPANPTGGTLAGVTVGMWKEEDDIKVAPQANDGTYSFDALVIRTQNKDMTPAVHQRVVGSEVVVSGLAEGHVLRLVSGNDVVFEGEAVGSSATVASGTYKVVVIDTTDGDATTEEDEDASEAVEAGEVEAPTRGLSELVLKEGERVSVSATAGQVTGIINVAAESSPIELRDSNLTYDASHDTWVATNLKAGADYEVEFRRHVVKVVHTSATGGHTWFGRYAEADLTWFANGWLDQAALPTNDSRIITSTNMSYAPDERFTTNTTPLTTGNEALRTANNQAWLQDASTARTYQYATVTDANGSIVNYRIGAGTYVLAEVKPPVDYDLHKTWLPDTVAHHFTVDDITGYITDTDDKTGGYAADHHNASSHKPEQKKRFAFMDDVTKLRLSKREFAGSSEIPGAELVLTADNNDEIDRWTSTTEPHYIENLTPGWYRLTERMTPKDYDKAESIEFNLLPTGEIQHTVMYDKPISIDAEIDKRQEIANPLGDGDYANGDGKNRANPQDNDSGLYAYSLDFRSNSNTWTDEFTVEDPLEPANRGQARLLSVVTPQAFQDYDGKVNVWYKTNLTPDDYIEVAGDTSQEDGDDETEASEDEGDASDDTTGDLSVEVTDSAGDATDGATGDDDADDTGDDVASAPSPVRYAANATLEDGHENPWLHDREAMSADTDGDGRVISYVGWRLWEKDVPAAVATKLDVADLALPDNEHVTGIRFEYGRVEVGFTTRLEDWDRDLLKDEHDDLDRISGLSSQSFQAADMSANAAAARMRILTARFTTDASFMLEDAAARAREQAKRDYENQIIEAQEYNRLLEETASNKLPKFVEALVTPAYTDDMSDTRMLDAAAEAAKASLQASFSIATTEASRKTLLTTARQAIADIDGIVSAETLASLNDGIATYDREIDRLPSDAGGQDIDDATANLLNAFVAAVDDIRISGFSGRVMYAPAVIHMQLTDGYHEGIVMRNSATVDAYRNGGNADGRPGIRTTLTNKATGDHAIGSEGPVTVVDVVEYHGLTPGTEYVMSGTLMVKEKDSDVGIPLVDDGEEVTASTIFTPTESNGTVSLEFSFHAELLSGGKSAVAFEECRLSEGEAPDDGGEPGDTPSDTPKDTFVAEHKNLNDGWQTVNETGDVDLPERGNLEGHDRDEVIQTPLHKTDEFIGTRLATVDGGKIITGDMFEDENFTDVILIDTVDYHNLIPGKRYQLDGTLHVRILDFATKEVTDGGVVKGSAGTTTFTPEQSDGSVEVKLVLPADLVMRTAAVVAFEELREVDEASGVASDTIVAMHKDILDANQTVDFSDTSVEHDTSTVPLLQTGSGWSIIAAVSSLVSVAGLGIARLRRAEH